MAHKSLHPFHSTIAPWLYHTFCVPICTHFCCSCISILWERIISLKLKWILVTRGTERPGLSHTVPKYGIKSCWAIYNHQKQGPYESVYSHVKPELPFASSYWLWRALAPVVFLPQALLRYLKLQEKNLAFVRRDTVVLLSKQPTETLKSTKKSCRCWVVLREKSLKVPLHKPLCSCTTLTAYPFCHLLPFAKISSRHSDEITWQLMLSALNPLAVPQDYIATIGHNYSL